MTMKIKQYNVSNKIFGGININSYDNKKNSKYCSFTDKNISLTTNINAKLVEEQVKNLSLITFEITEDCNLSCKYCAYSKFYDFAENRTKKKISWAFIKKTLDYILDYKKENSTLNVSFYGGEPLLEMELIKKTVSFCKDYSEKKIFFTFSLTTNAILLYKNISFFINNNFNLLISLDGNKKANSLRVFKNGKESYDILMKNILQIKEKYPIYYKNNISFNTVLHQKNDIYNIHNFFKKLNKITNISSVATSNLSPLFNKEFMTKIFKDYYDDYQKNYQKLKDMEGNIRTNPNFQPALLLIQNYSAFKAKNYNDLFIEYADNLKYKPTGTCLPFSKKMFITVDGKILPCERINYKYSLGKVTENNIELNFEDIAKTYSNYYKKMSMQCNKCALKDNCQTCMFDLNMEDDKPKCNNFTTKKRAETYYTEIIEFLEEQPKILKTILYDTISSD